MDKKHWDADGGGYKYKQNSDVSVSPSVHSSQPEEDHEGDNASDDHGDGQDEADDEDVPFAIVGTLGVGETDLNTTKMNKFS